MNTRTSQLWAKQDRHPGDRHRLFTAVSAALPVSSVLYPGPYVDIAPSFVFDDVTYIDTDRRARQFFDDTEGVDQVIAQYRQAGSSSKWQFVQAGYTTDLLLPRGHFDLLVSLYAGFVSEHCTRYLRPGGHLLVNSSHGDFAMASIDSSYRLVAVIKSRSGSYTIINKELDTYLVPKRPITTTADTLHRSGRGVGYTKPAYAYLFEHRAQPEIE